MLSPDYFVYHDDKKSIPHRSDAVSIPTETVAIEALLTAWGLQYRSFYTLSDLFSAAVHELHEKISLQTTYPIPVLTTDAFNTLQSIQRLKHTKQRFIMTLTRERLTELDALLADMTINEQFDILKSMYYFLIKSVYLDDIKINFSEVFLVEAGESPPLDYRSSVDRVVTTVAEYQQQTTGFSYQLMRTLLGRIDGFNVPHFRQSRRFPWIWLGRYRQKNIIPHKYMKHIFEVKAY